MTVFVHTGLVKTGSTFLQECIFPHLDLIQYCRKDVAREQVRAILAPTKSPILANPPWSLATGSQHQALFSNEKLSGHPGLNYENFSGNVASLKAHMPQAYI